MCFPKRFETFVVPFSLLTTTNVPWSSVETINGFAGKGALIFSVLTDACRRWIKAVTGEVATCQASSTTPHLSHGERGDIAAKGT